MHFSALLFPLLVALNVAAQHFCGTPEPIRGDMQIARILQDNEMKLRASNVQRAETAGLEINMCDELNSFLLRYFLINSLALDTTMSSPTTQQPNPFPSAADLTRQTDVLNKAYQPHNITWKQAGADWTYAPQWAINKDELAMEKEATQRHIRGPECLPIACDPLFQRHDGTPGPDDLRRFLRFSAQSDQAFGTVVSGLDCA